MQELHGMLIFAKVVELGSFSKAALHLGLAKSSVSKKVSALEQELGVRLLQRTTRSLHITEEGQTLFERCLRIQRELEVAKEEVAGFRDKPQGKLRISASPLFGQLRLAPLLPEFLTRYPEITIDLQLSVDQSDLIAEGYDLAIRFGELPDSSLIAKRLTSVRPICCASQSYLETHGHPHTPADLKQHNCISWQPPDRPRVTHWEFSKGSKKHRIPFRGNFVSNDFLAIKTAVLCGGGITLLPSYLLHEEMEQGTLQELLPEYPMPEVPVYLLYPQRRRLPAKVRTFISFLHAAGI